MSNLGPKLKCEVRELIPVLVCCFFSFQLLVLKAALMFRQQGISGLAGSPGLT
jgi:hypothetical protein